MLNRAKKPRQSFHVWVNLTLLMLFTVSFLLYVSQYQSSAYCPLSTTSTGTTSM